MTIKTGNIFAKLLPSRAEHEMVELLVDTGIKIQRIVSCAHASPEDFWYDQDHDEWVILLAGSAGLLIEGEAEPRNLETGDYIELPAHLRHRIAWTDADQP